jgi:eukaryotic-like serine/threonine-protein kinase
VGALDPEGRPIARKVANRPNDVTGLAWETEVLTAARHPGVVEVVASSPGTLDTTYCGTHSLATWRPGSVERVAALAAALATTVADLHGMGIVHGRIEPSHVLIGPGGRPVMCGFSGATLSGRAAPGSVGPIDPAADVDGVGSLVSFLVRGGDRHCPRAGRHRFLALAFWPVAARRRAALRHIAAAATEPEPRLRPTARALAAALHDVAPRARLDDRPLPEAMPAEATARPVRRRAVAAIGAALALGLLGWAAVTLARPPTTQPSAASATTTEPAPTASAAPHPVADARVIGANLIEAEGVRFEVGVPGDRAIIGDWDCDAVPTVALLRPSTGEVFLFDEWAASDAALTIPAAAHVPGAESIAAHDPDGDGCASVLVERSDGRRPVEVTG